MIPCEIAGPEQLHLGTWDPRWANAPFWFGNSEQAEVEPPRTNPPLVMGLEPLDLANLKVPLLYAVIMVGWKSWTEEKEESGIRICNIRKLLSKPRHPRHGCPQKLWKVGLSLHAEGGLLVGWMGLKPKGLWLNWVPGLGFKAAVWRLLGDNNV